MGRIVQKYGGSSVATIEKIIRVAERIKRTAKEGHEMVVVVSAMGDTTDELLGMAKSISLNPDKRELDMLLTTGEQVSSALLAMALQETGEKAVSLTGWQAGIRTESVHGNARILQIDTKRIEEELAEGKIVVVTGFQGVTEAGEITALGRGGSDTTAVALAAALHADRCEIYTDVTGVFTSDPRWIKKARKLPAVSYDEMIEMAHLGAQVLHPRSVEFAKNFRVPLVVRSSMSDEEGTWIVEEEKMEKNLIVRGVAFEKNITRITVHGLPDVMENLSAIFTGLARENVDVDIIIQNVSGETENQVSFSVKDDQLNDALAVLEKLRGELGFKNVEWESGLAKVSIVGSGMVSNPGVAAKMFSTLAENGIFIKMISTSEIKISVVVDEEQMIRAAETLHQAFGLDRAEREVKTK
ncbi:aspartate kinase [Caldibacillus debilis]|jgi:aspartate kinase|uniref:Aspartokinase n=1 Tax=Caldibacillus debilis GB1 TaxID=1339248 RepID=A0A420VIZ9_9BACI|nr:aspartate kinase [Caldibacillus debilis]RKO63510.1 aspartate kinase [Caldibacillus debilis GB1]